MTKDGDLGNAPPAGVSAPPPPSAPSVLQVLPRLVTGGVERGTIEIAGALAAAGWRAVVASEGGPMVAELLRAGGRHFELPLASKSPVAILRNVARLAELIEREGIDIVHARSRAPAWSAFLAARRTGRPFVTTFHNAYGHSTRLRRLYNGVMARGERVIAISEFVGKHAAETYGVAADRLRVIPRGVDLDRFDPRRVGMGRVAELARAWDLPAGAPVAMLPGRLTRWKGQLDLLRALSRLGRRDVACVFVGGGEQGSGGFRAEIEREAERLGLAGRVRLVGECRDMPAAYLLADVVVSASNRPEGFGRVAAEAQAMGRPVVATDHGGARETVIPGATGWLVPPGDDGALAAALREALALDPAARERLAAQAIAHIGARFTREAMCRRTLAVYEEVLAARGRAPGGEPRRVPA